MYIDRDIEQYTISETDSLTSALRKLNVSKKRVVFTTDEKGRLKGAFSDGDFRRWVLNASILDLETSVGEVANKKFTFANEDDDIKEVADKLSQKILLIPILDENGVIIKFASLEQQSISIGRHNINAESQCFLIAEIGNNHNGSLKLAKKLVDEAVKAGADCAKFQMRDLDSLYVNSGNANDVSEDLGSQYVLDLLSRFQLNDQDFGEIFDYCRTKKLAVLCTPFDQISVDKLEAFDVEAYKIASADLTNHDLLKYVALKRKPMIVSTGMATEEEIQKAVDVLRESGANFILLHCNSTYPTPFKDVNLKYLDRLREISSSPVGYSGHERGYSIPLAAVALGAKVVEKHFTLDKSMEGNDHKVSLLPDEFRQMVQFIRQIEDGLGNARSRVLSQGELMNRETLAKSVVAIKNIEVGQLINESMLDIKSPGKGLPPYMKQDLIGTKSKRNMIKGDFFYKSDLVDKTVNPKKYNFELPFGIPVRYHDMKTLGKMSNFDMLEFHLSYKDLEVDLEEYFDEKQNFDFAVHAPELFAGDHTLDLCSSDDNYRANSIAQLQKVVDITRKLKRYFPKTKIPVIVCNVGGFTSDRFLEEIEKDKLYGKLANSLCQIDSSGVELIPQTMPPFPWHFGGQQFHNLFVSAEDIVSFCDRQNMRICFDVSHSKLACNHFGWDFNEFVEKVAKYSAHLHIADAKGSDGEGLQIGEGEIDFDRLFTQFRFHCPNASWIPEIWQGHKNNGEGFWSAFNILSANEL